MIFLNNSYVGLKVLIIILKSKGLFIYLNIILEVKIRYSEVIIFIFKI